MEAYYEFEKPIVALEQKLEELKTLSVSQKVDFTQEIKILEKKLLELTRTTYESLTPWQRVQVSRHPNRPHASDYLDQWFPDFKDLAGDRAFGEDAALIGGIASWKLKDRTIPVLVLAHQKGRTTKQKMERNFGMPKPEGYRKAQRLMKLAERARIPILSLLDTPGAYPGLDAEERGQSQAIAECLTEALALTVPTLALVIGEGGSGGALAIGLGDPVFMLEFSTYSVISPESCASILWNDPTLAERATERLKLSAPDLMKLEVIDGIIPEPLGGAHRNWEATFEKTLSELHRLWDPELQKFLKKPEPDQIRARRLEKYRKMGSLALPEAPRLPKPTKKAKKRA
jgi:acetyl-CoA carboxylase carboxyl transferase subunit alpha